MMEDERDRAEDRLKIEQTQRDSIERLRQRNKELEEQLRKLCETQVRGGKGKDFRRLDWRVESWWVQVDMNDAYEMQLWVSVCVV